MGQKNIYCHNHTALARLGNIGRDDILLGNSNKRGDDTVVGSLEELTKDLLCRTLPTAWMGVLFCFIPVSRGICKWIIDAIDIRMTNDVNILKTALLFSRARPCVFIRIAGIGSFEMRYNESWISRICLDPSIDPVGGVVSSDEEEISRVV